MENKLTPLEAIHVVSALEDCVDQLFVLNSVIAGKPEINQEKVDTLTRLLEQRKLLEAQYVELISPEKSQDEYLENELTKKIHKNTLEINKFMRINKSHEDSGQKIHKDLHFVLNVLESTLLEVKSQHTFNSLVEIVEKEKENKKKIQDVISKEEESRKRLKQLQKAVIDTKKEQEIELENKNELIANLKDKLQEIKAKTNMEVRYLKKDAEVRLACFQKKSKIAEQDLRNELATLNRQVEDESRCNVEIETFLRLQHTLLEEKVEYWMNKYDTDVENKQLELDNLKQTKLADLTRLQELTETFFEYSKVIEEDRLEKEAQLEKEKLELKEKIACSKIQAWWRGIMVRQQLGPFKPKKKKKGTKGKKKGKKK
ncbi:dynein regulatory complex protein 9 isoform X1 [Hydra vulgaris]|uniref:IQ domain-containing protein G n=1 Tax=Hydra vulgaris TaxID=6087 RepID=T2M6B1_HYDVU|nr:dynein regulatory complex protein 9 [Hydra vulgaris]